MWNEVLTTIVTLVVTALVTSFVIPMIKAGADWLKAKANNTKLNGAIDAAQKVAEDVVHALEQTTVGALREKKLTTEAIAEIKAKALDMFFNDLPSSMLAVIEENETDLESWADDLIQAALKKMKLWNNSVFAKIETPTDVEG
jgi:hypothetical protein